MSKIQKTAKQALVTFKSIDTPSFSGNLERLKAMMSALTASDINLDIPEKTEARTSRKGSAPVSYISIYDSKHFSLGVFILKKKVSIPLHDHPGMFGICKVLYGAVRVKSFDPILSNGNEAEPHIQKTHNGKLIKCYSAGEKIINSESVLCHLTPNSGNYHSIHSHEGQAAFIDILAPPYVTGERDCSYFMEYKSIDRRSLDNPEENDNVRWLIEIPQPAEFFCDSLPYRGPPIDLEE